jgi:hypothetical protein
LINFTRTFKVISGKDGLNTLAVDSVTKAGDKNLFCIMGHAGTHLEFHQARMEREWK